jgi:hypothetical protein
LKDIKKCTVINTSTFNSSLLEDNIKITLQELERGSMDWIDLAQNLDRWRALVNAVINLRVPKTRKIA